MPAIMTVQSEFLCTFLSRGGQYVDIIVYCDIESSR